MRNISTDREIEEKGRESIERARHNDEHNRLNARLLGVSSPLNLSFGREPTYAPLATGKDDYLSREQVQQVVSAYQVESFKGRFSYEEKEQPNPFGDQTPLGPEEIASAYVSRVRGYG